MKINHYVHFSSHSIYLPKEQILKVDLRELKDLQFPQNAYRAIFFDRIISEVEYNGKSYPTATKKLNRRIYYIGTYKKIEEYPDQDATIRALAKSGGCIGFVTDCSGIEHLIFEGEGVMDINHKILIKCTVPTDENFEEIDEISEPEH